MDKIFTTNPGIKDQIPEDLCRRINNFARGHVEIVAIYIFGSIATAKKQGGK